MNLCSLYINRRAYAVPRIRRHVSKVGSFLRGNQNSHHFPEVSKVVWLWLYSLGGPRGGGTLITETAAGTSHRVDARDDVVKSSKRLF